MSYLRNVSIGALTTSIALAATVLPTKYNNISSATALETISLASSASPGEITTNPQKYRYKTVSVTAEVEDIKGDGVFTLDEEKIIGGRDLLVIVPNNFIMPREGNKVTVRGVVRPFVLTNFEHSYDLTWDLDLEREIEAEYTDRLVLVATSILISPD